mgnify:CR=1 FL=1
MSDDLKNSIDGLDTLLGRTNATVRAMLANGGSIPEGHHAGVTAALVQMLESGLKVALWHIQGKRDPYRGASEQVCLQCLDTIDLMRRAGVLPERMKP